MTDPFWFRFSAFFTVIILETGLVLIFFTGSNINWTEILKRAETKCDVVNSTIVRKVIQKSWTPVLNRYNVSLPIDCPLNLSRDLLGVREPYKQRHSSYWKCGKCGKRFYLEKYLDLHIDKRHSDIIRKADDSVCLGNYCDVMRCDILKLIQPDGIVSTDLSIWTPGSSTTTTLATIGSNNEAGSQKTTQNSQKSSTTPNIRKPEFQIQNECDEEYFANLRTKCSEIIWKCIQGLISVLDAADFKIMQDDLEGSSCSYLSCSQFGDKHCGQQQSKFRGMRPFLLVFGSLLISLCLALAYYFAWIYTQSSEDQPHRTGPSTSSTGTGISKPMSSKTMSSKYYQPYLESDKPPVPGGGGESSGSSSIGRTGSTSHQHHLLPSSCTSTPTGKSKNSPSIVNRTSHI